MNTPATIPSTTGRGRYFAIQPVMPDMPITATAIPAMMKPPVISAIENLSNIGVNTAMPVREEAKKNGIL